MFICYLVILTGKDQHLFFYCYSFLDKFKTLEDQLQQSNCWLNEVRIEKEDLERQRNDLTDEIKILESQRRESDRDLQLKTQRCAELEGLCM